MNSGCGNLRSMLAVKGWRTTGHIKQTAVRLAPANYSARNESIGFESPALMERQATVDNAITTVNNNPSA